jgi:AcrR family transcriptional regulator
LSAPLDTRARILQTALELFAKHGYQRTSLREIAEILGVTKPAILYHFNAKADILAALVEPLLEATESLLAATAPLDQDRRAWAVIEGWLDAALKHRGLIDAIHRDVAVLRQEPLARWVRLTFAVNEVVAGPDAGPAERVRAAQLVAMLTDPLVVCSDLPDDLLRREVLAGVRLLFGSPGSPGPAGSPGLPGSPMASERRRGAGRPSVMSTEKLAAAQRMHAAGSHTVEEIAATLGVSRATLYRHLDDQ